MNTGIQDATNLAWKVALAVSGDVASAEKLLQTYHEERHPQGEAAIRFSGGLHGPMCGALGILAGCVLGTACTAGS